MVDSHKIAIHEHKVKLCFHLEAFSEDKRRSEVHITKIPIYKLIK